jgi:hypothetical protein
LAATERRGVGNPGAGSSEEGKGVEEEEFREEPADGGGGGGTREIVQTAASAALDAVSASDADGVIAEARAERGTGTASAERVQSVPSASSVAGSVGCAARPASGLFPSHFTRAPRRSPAPTPDGAGVGAFEADFGGPDEEKLTAAARRFADPGGQ